MSALLTTLVIGQRDRLDPHGQGEQCQACHDGPPPEGVSQPPGPGQRRGATPYPLRFERERAVCERCHTGRGRRTHPTEVKPSMRTPADWPLDARGRLMCSTCHDPHRARVPSGKSHAWQLLRRDEKGLAFCQQCHGELARGDIQAWHIVAAGSAHGAEAAAAPTLGGTLDPQSRRCLECHDGTTARGVGVRVGDAVHGRGAGSSHPVGVRYPDAPPPPRRGERSPRLRSPAFVDKRIRFFDGKVGCGSCHDLYSGNRDFLAIETRRGALCLACHDK